MSSSNVETEFEVAPMSATLIEASSRGQDARVFGLDARERLCRSFTSCGMDVIDSQRFAHFNDERVVALRTSHFYDNRLIVGLAEDPGGLVLFVDGAESEPTFVGIVAAASTVKALTPALQDGTLSVDAANEAGLKVAYPTDIVPAYDAKLRKHAPPFILPADPTRTGEIQNRIFDASYKGVTDFVTKWVWPVPARIVTGWCARRGIAPNSVTAVSYLLTLFSLVAFGLGAFSIGLVSAWIMTFLDTVDGKLARVTLTSSRLGDFLDHGLDIIHPPLWWAAWGAGLAGSGALFEPFGIWVAIAFIGYIVGRLLEGLFILAFGQEMFTWRPFDFGFRLVIARRNPNLVLLTGATMFGRPDLGLIALGIWTVCCIAIQCVRIAQAAAFHLRGHEITPFAHPEPAKGGAR